MIRPARAQSGMAVIAMLLLVAVIALMASALLARQTTVLYGVQNEHIRLQGQWLLRGEISRSQVVLYDEARRTPVTRLDGRWRQPRNGVIVGQLGGATARIFSEIDDEQAKFNLRNLVDNGEMDARETAAFLRLCALVGVSREQASLIARRVATSLVDAESPGNEQLNDQDAQAAQAAAESIGLSHLSRRELAPRLRDLSDLLAVPGISASSITRLQPYVTMLPQRSWINANTAGPEVLAAWVPGLTLERAKALLVTRDNGQWFINRGDFTRRLQMPELDEIDIMIGITSQWFRFNGALRTPQRTLLIQALLFDNKANLPQVIWLREGT